MGLSPFKGAISKFLIVYSCIENTNYILAAAAILGSIIEAWYFIKIIHKVCFAESAEDELISPDKTSLLFKRISYGVVIILATLTALTSVYPLVLINFSEHLAKSLFGIASIGELPEFDSPWSLLIMVPYIGAFTVFIVGHFLPKFREILAVAISGATVVMVWMDGSIDSLSKLFAIVISMAVFLALVYSIGYFKGEKHNNSYFFFLLLTMGSLLGVATSTAFGNFYVFWELMTWSSYLLIVHEPTERALKAGF